MMCMHSSRPRGRRRIVRRGFNLVELLLALAITGALLSATMVALDASFMAYQTTTEVASTHTIGRLVMSRMLTLIRTGTEFGTDTTWDPRETVTTSDLIDFRLADGNILTIRWDEMDEALYVDQDGLSYVLLEGVPPQYDDGGVRIKPFTVEYELGRVAHRVTIDLTVVPDDNMSLELEGDNTDVIRLVASAMPRAEAYQN